MFEWGGGAEGDGREARFVAVMPADPDHRPWDDPGYDAWIDELAAADPEPPDPDEVQASRRVRVAELLAAGQSAPVDGVLAGQLDALDPAELDQDQRLALAAAQQRVANHVEARRGQAIAAYAADAEPVLGLAARAAAAADVGAVLHLAGARPTSWSRPRWRSPGGSR